VIRKLKGIRDDVIFTRPCWNHVPDGPTLSVVIRAPGKYSSAEVPKEWGRACILCWTVLERYDFQQDKKPLAVVTSVPGTNASTRIDLGEIHRIIWPTKKDSKSASESLHVNPCESHPKIRVPVSIFQYRPTSEENPAGWYSDGETLSCPICWTYSEIKKVPLERLPVVD
jgi:hypothetical protein